MYKKNLRREISVEQVNNDAKKNLTKLVYKSEAYYQNQIQEIVAAVTCPKSKIKLILVAGPSSAGKTTTSNVIMSELKKRGFSSIIISLDDFYIDRANTPRFSDGSYDFENITTLDLPVLNRFVDDLLKFHKAKMPTFNFVTGKREEKWNSIEIDDHTILIIEGLHALNPRLIKSHKKEIYKVYLNLNANYVKSGRIILPAKKIRLIRRITRDFYTRGYSVLETLANWKNVCEGEDRWVKPFKRTADYIIDSVHDYEILLYANYSKPILKEAILEKSVEELIKNEHSIDKKGLILNRLYVAKELYQSLTYSTETAKDIVPENSLLLEFIGSAEDMVESTGKIFN